MNPFERNPPTADAAYEAGIELAENVQHRANEIFSEALVCEGSLMEALAECCESANYGFKLADVLMTDEVEVGRRVRLAILKWLAHDSEVLARKELNV